MVSGITQRKKMPLPQQHGRVRLPQAIREEASHAIRFVASKVEVIPTICARACTRPLTNREIFPCWRLSIAYLKYVYHPCPSPFPRSKKNTWADTNRKVSCSIARPYLFWLSLRCNEIFIAIGTRPMPSAIGTRPMPDL